MRTGKFYRRNERETLEKLGFKAVPGSGSGWIAKEDGENEIALVQLKSTDSSSYTLKMLDMRTLEYNAAVEHKVPIFVIQFLKQDKLYAVVNISDLSDLFDAIRTGEVKERTVIKQYKEDTAKRSKIKSNIKAREQFYKERDENFASKKRK